VGGETVAEGGWDGFQIVLPIARMWKDGSGAMWFEGTASSTSRDKQRERMTPRAIQKMAQYRGIDLLPAHDAGPLEELGTIEETSADNQYLRVAGRLDETSAEARRLFEKVLRGKQYQLSVGGRVTSAYWGTDEDGERVRFIDDVELDHVALCRPGRAANPDTYLRAIAKSLEGPASADGQEARGLLDALKCWWPFAAKAAARDVGSGAAKGAAEEVATDTKLRLELEALREQTEGLAKQRAEVGEWMAALQERVERLELQRGLPQSVSGQEKRDGERQDLWKGVLAVERG